MMMMTITDMAVVVTTVAGPTVGVDPMVDMDPMVDTEDPMVDTVLMGTPAAMDNRAPLL